MENQTELRLRALELSLEHGYKLFPQQNHKSPSEILSNAKRIVKILTTDWEKPIDDCLDKHRFPTFKSNP